MSRHVLALPLELRVFIYDYVITDEVVLPGPLPAGVLALLATSKQTKSEVLSRLWRAPRVSWQGTFTSTTWNKFRKIAMPYIRSLTIAVHVDPRASWYMDNDFHQLLQWMCRRCKPGSKARYYWALENLTLMDGPRPPVPNYALWCRVDRRWSRRDPYGRCGCGGHRKWILSGYEEALVEKLRGCGVEVKVHSA